jgi:hypothetical protein
MKKSKTLILSAAVILLFSAVPSYSAETTFSGQYRVRAYSEFNFDKIPGMGPPAYEALYSGWFEQRFRLSITHKRSEYLKAVVVLDLVEDTWGTERAMRINDSAQDAIDHAYLEFTLPDIGLFTAGRFPETYGFGLLYSDDGNTGVYWEKVFDMFSVSLGYKKLDDRVVNKAPAGSPLNGGPTTRWYNRDTDMYSFNLTFAPFDNHFFELFGGAVFSNTGTILNNSYGWAWNSPTVNPLDMSADVGFVGLAYFGTIGRNIDIRFEYDRIFGSAHMDDYFRPASAGGIPYSKNPSIEGWNVYLDVSYYTQDFLVGLGFVMGSGERHFWGPESVNHINLNYISENEFTWGNIICGYAGINSPWDTGLAFSADVENLTSVRLYGEVYPTEKLTVSAAVIWAKWTNPVGTNPLTGSYTNPAYPHPANWYSVYRPTAGGPGWQHQWQSWEASDDLGWEVDLNVEYEIMEGLTYQLSCGVLFTGDSWDYVDYRGGRQDWGPIWSVVNTIEYIF